MTTNTGYAPDLSFLKLPDDKLEKVSELLGAALQSHQALNTFAWYRKSTQSVKDEVRNLKTQLTDATGAQFEKLATQIQDRTGVDIRKMIPSGEDGGDSIISDLTKKLVSGDYKGAASTLGKAAKDTALEKLKAVNPEVAGYVDKALNGDLATEARNAALDKLKELNPDSAKFVQQAMDGNIKEAARGAALERIKSIPEAGPALDRIKTIRNLAQDPATMKQAVVDSAKARISAATTPLSDEVTNIRQSLGKEGINMFEGGDSMLRTLGSTSNNDFRDFLQNSRASAEPVVQGISREGATTNLFRSQKFADDIGDDDPETGPRRTLLDTFETRPIFSKARSAISDTLDRLKSSVVTGSDSTLARALIAPSEESSGGLGLGSAVNDLAGVAGLADAIKSGNKPAIGMASSGLASSLGQTVGSAIGSEALESASGFAGQALGLAGLGMAIKSGNRDAIAQQSGTLGLGAVSNALKSSATDAVKQATSELTTGASDTLTSLGEAGTSIAKSAGSSVAKSIGESLGEKIGEDTAETAALDGTGIGEVIDAGLAISQLVTSFIDLFKSKPKQPAIFEGNQVGLSS